MKFIFQNAMKKWQNDAVKNKFLQKTTNEKNVISPSKLILSQNLFSPRCTFERLAKINYCSSLV